MKKIKSTLAPLFKKNNRGKSFVVSDINRIKTRNRESITSQDYLKRESKRLTFIS